MMNLVIGIISEKLSELLDNRIQNNYMNLLDIVIDLETFHFWRRIGTRETITKHLLFADSKKEEEQGERIREVTN
jgi:hypothetical protein